MKDNNGQSVYGGSDLVCARGGWDALEQLALLPHVRAAVDAGAYDEAMRAYPGFMASRRNYDVGRGIDADGRRRFGVLNPRGALAVPAARNFSRRLHSHGTPTLRSSRHLAWSNWQQPQPPPDAVVHFHGEDPEAGPVLRYSVVTGAQAESDISSISARGHQLGADLVSYSFRTCTDYSLLVSRRTAKRSGHHHRPEHVPIGAVPAVNVGTVLRESNNHRPTQERGPCTSSGAASLFSSSAG